MLFTKSCESIKNLSIIKIYKRKSAVLLIFLEIHMKRRTYHLLYYGCFPFCSEAKGEQVMGVYIEFKKNTHNKLVNRKK
jgi:hypothetical protein